MPEGASLSNPAAGASGAAMSRRVDGFGASRYLAGRAGARSEGAMLKKLYNWTLGLAARKSAEVWLGVIAFVESSVFLVPADVLYIPMALSRPERAYRYAFVATVFSVLGGIAGYFVGMFAYDAIAAPMLELYGKKDDFDAMAACVQQEKSLIATMLVTSGLAHLPPIKVVTILSGVVKVSLAWFIVSCILARGARFFALAWALKRWGEPIKHFIEKRLALIAGLAAAALIALYFIVKQVLGHGALAC
jgi:membrane protein YqaA with SNARE-associated domain